MQDITLKLTIDGKEAIATLKLTDQELVNMAAGLRQVNETSKSTAQSLTSHFADIRNTIQGIKEAYDVFKETLAEPLIKGAELEVLRQNFKGTTEDMELFKKAVAGTVGEAGLIKLSNQATDLGLSLNQQAILFSLAEDSADKYGTTVEEGFQKAVMASEGNVKGLKALGIQRKVYEDILKSLAESQGKELKDMDAEEVKQLRLQALIKASGVTLEDVAKKQADSKDKLEQMGVAFEEVVATGGQAIATVFIPMLKHISDLVNKLNETAPALTGLAAGVVMVGGAYSTLNMTGILPFIINTKTLSYEMQFAKLTFIETAEAEGVLAASTAAASTAAKGFFTSIGPIGWAIIGFTALAEAINLFSQKTEDAKQGLSAEEKELIKAQIEFNNLANAVNNTKNSEQGRKDALDKLNKTYPEYLGKQINDINNQQVLNNAVANGNKLLREKITLLANNRVLQEKQNKAVDDRAKVVNLEQDLEDYKKLHPDENEIIEEDRGSIDNPGYTVKVVRAKDIMDKMRTKINEANKIAEQSNNEYLDTQNRLGVNKPSDKVELTRGDEKKKLNAELDDLNKQLDGTKATDTKAQNTLLSKIRAVKSKLKKYKDEESEDSGKSSKSDKLTEGYELDVVKSEYPNQKLKDNDAVKKKYEKIIEDSTSSISQFKTISDVVLSHLKTVEEKKKYLEEVEKKAEEKMNAANDKDHPNATKLYYTVREKLADYNNGLLNSLDEELKTLETQKKSAITLDELLKIQVQINEKQKERDKIDVAFKDLEMQDKSEQAKLNYETEKLNKAYEEAKSTEEQVKIYAEILKNQNNLALLKESIENKARHKAPRVMTDQEKRDYDNNISEQKIDDSDANDFDKQREKAKLERDKALAQAEIDNFVNKEEIKHNILEKFSKTNLKIDKDEAEQKKENFKSTINYIATGFNQYTAVAKGAAAVQAGINVSEAITTAYKAAPPPFNFILAGLVAAAGLKQVNDIISARPPQMKGYARGGIVVGEKGPEIIEPMQDYAEGQAMLVANTIQLLKNKIQSFQTTREINSGFDMIRLEDLFNKHFDAIEKIPSTFKFVQKGTDLIAVTTKAQNKIKRMSYEV